MKIARSKRYISRKRESRVSESIDALQNIRNQWNKAKKFEKNKCRMIIVGLSWLVITMISAMKRTVTFLASLCKKRYTIFFNDLNFFYCT